MDAAASPLPSEETTPPVTKMYFTDRPSGRCVMAASCSRRNRQQLAAYALQVLRRVDADGVVFGFDRVNAIAVLERAELFERFGSLERRLRKGAELQQEGAVIAVEADVLVAGIGDRGSGIGWV